jgi:hypothetical protein
MIRKLLLVSKRGLLRHSGEGWAASSRLGAFTGGAFVAFSIALNCFLWQTVRHDKPANHPMIALYQRFRVIRVLLAR